MKFLTRQEEFVLLAVHQLQTEASLKNIRTHLVQSTGKDWSVSSVYVPLDRLAQAGYLDTHHSDPVARPGGKAKRFYRLSSEGMEALSRLRSLTDRMWQTLAGSVAEES